MKRLTRPVAFYVPTDNRSPSAVSGPSPRAMAAPPPRPPPPPPLTLAPAPAPEPTRVNAEIDRDFFAPAVEGPGEPPSFGYDAPDPALEPPGFLATVAAHCGSLASWWTNWTDPMRAVTVDAAVAVVLREIHRRAPEGAPVDTRIDVRVPPGIDAAGVGRRLRLQLDLEPDFRSVPVSVENMEEGERVSVMFAVIPVVPFTVRIVFDGATEVRFERIGSGRRRLRLGRGEQRGDGTLNHVAFDSAPALRWIPRALLDIEWSSSLGRLVLDVPVETADSVAVILRRKDDRVIAEAGEAEPLEVGDMIVIEQVNGEGGITLDIIAGTKEE